MSRRVASRRWWLTAVALFALAGGGCDRIRERLDPPPVGDTQWTNDSTLLAAAPQVLFRVQSTPKGDRVIPMATIGAGGYHGLYMGGRGWRAFDLAYMQRGHELLAVREGRNTGRVPMERGMWDPPDAPLDTTQVCPILVPAGRARIGGETKFLTAQPIGALRPVTGLAGGELNAELSKVSTLVLPTLGIGASVLPRFTRSVHTLATGVESTPTIVIVYDDPQRIADSLPVMNERPRHAVIILDKGTFGYRASYRYRTVGNGKTPPRYRFLDFVDLNGDGKGELLFGVDDDRISAVATVVLRYENDSWKEMARWQMMAGNALLARVGTRCQL